MPLSSTWGLTGRVPGDSEGNYAKQTYVHQVGTGNCRRLTPQMWPHLTDDNIQHALRGSTTADRFPASLAQIYRGLETCYQHTNAAMDLEYRFRPDRPNFQLWPAEFPSTAAVSLNPLANICHWNFFVYNGPASPASCFLYGEPNFDLWFDTETDRTMHCGEALVFPRSWLFTDRQCATGGRPLVILIRRSANT